MWSYERDGRWRGWSFVRGSTVLGMYAHNITSKSTLGNVFTVSINKHKALPTYRKKYLSSFNDNVYWIPCQWRCNSCDYTVVFGQWPFGHLSRGVTRGVCSELIAHWPAHSLGGLFACVLKPCLFVLPPQIGSSAHQLHVSVDFDSCLFVPWLCDQLTQPVCLLLISESILSGSLVHCDGHGHSRGLP